MYCLQQWYGLADEALEDALYDSQALRDFVGIDLSRESVPDATTLLKFRRLLLANDLTKALFDQINADLAEQELLMRAGTIEDATIIAAPSLTKNESNARDPEMHQTKKGNQWHFGMKAHIGVDAESGLVHTVVGTAANVNDVTQAGALLHGDETAAHGDNGELNNSIAQRLKLTNATVGKWRMRFIERRISGLYDDVRPGKPRTIDDERIAQLIKTTLHTKPADGSMH